MGGVLRSPLKDKNGFFSFKVDSRFLFYNRLHGESFSKDNDLKGGIRDEAKRYTGKDK